MSLRTAVVTPLRGASFQHGLKVNYSPTVALYRIEKDILQTSNQVHQIQVEDRLSKARPDELRWQVITNTSAKALPLSTQRNRLRRRWAAAFQQSLKRQGLARNGKKDLSQTSMPHTLELVGTLELVIFDAYGFNESTEELSSQTNNVVQALLRSAEGSRRLTFDRPATRDQRKGRW